jgi:predicted TIM-barrel fold metal-dependent hydrolase
LIIDSHAHVYRRPPGHHVPWPVERHLAVLDESGVTGSVIVQPSFFGTDHSELIAAIAAAPLRLRGVGVVDETFSLDEMKRLHAAGIRGIRLNFFKGSDADITSAAWREVIHMAQALGWNLELNARDEHMAVTLEQVRDLSIPITVDHFGRPDPTLGPRSPGFRALLEAGLRQTIYIKLTAPFRVSVGAAKECLASWLANVGPHRVLWGSDCPWVDMKSPPSYADTLAWLDECIPAPKDRAAVLGLNARALYDFPPGDRLA